MSKSELLVAIAGMPEADARLEAVRLALAGGTEPAPVSFRLLRMGEAAAETGLSRCTIWRAIREKKLRAVEIRKGSHRIPAEELRRFVSVVSE